MGIGTSTVVGAAAFALAISTSAGRAQAVCPPKVLKSYPCATEPASATEVTDDETRRVLLHARCPINWTGAHLKAEHSYKITLVNAEDWCDRDLPVRRSTRGFAVPDAGTHLKALFFALRRMRPVPDGNWFDVVGATSTGEIDPFTLCGVGTDADCTETVIVPKQDGELRLFVNDAIRSAPFFFYDNNHGSMTLDIRAQLPVR
jgi:hypothetical protein